MRVEYCPSCGNKNLYEVNRPQFCAQCGHSLSSTIASLATNVGSVRNNSSFQIDDPDGEDIFEVPVISKFEYEIDASYGAGRQTLGQLANSPEATRPTKLGRSEKIRSKSSKQKADNKPSMIKQTMKDCSSSSQPHDISD